MWGIRAIRVGVFLSGLLVTIASSGCSECCRNLWETKSAPPAAPADAASEPGATLGSWTRNPADGSKDQKALTPERIHGDIY